MFCREINLLEYWRTRYYPAKETRLIHRNNYSNSKLIFGTASTQKDKVHVAVQTWLLKDPRLIGVKRIIIINNNYERKNPEMASCKWTQFG